MKAKLFILVLIFTSIACGLQTAPARNSQNVTNAEKVTIYEDTQAASKTSTEVKFTVTAEDLNVRECAGTGCAVIHGLELQRGEIVVCTDFDTPVNGVYAWCKHDRGWSSMQYMEVVK